MSFVRSFQVSGFRNYAQGSVSELEGGFVLIAGQNGAGKTNLLEAISLLAPGRGLRGAKTQDLRKRDMAPGQSWSVNALVASPYGDVRIGTGVRVGDASGAPRRVCRVNGVDLKAQSGLADYMACVWLTPQMDQLFLGPAGERRRFFDRLVYAFDAAHAGRVSRYENLLSQRSKLLREAASTGGALDDGWLASLEAGMAETGVAIAAARLHALESLSAHLDEILGGTGFPLCRMQLSGGPEARLQEVPALEVEDEMRARLQEGRQKDALSGGASVGAHRTDLQVFLADKDMPAGHCSTGEQKALLCGIVLAHAVRTRAMRDAAPVLLLDEVAAHFDAGRRDALFGVLQDIGAQVFITTTEQPLFEKLDAVHLLVGNEAVTRVL